MTETTCYSRPTRRGTRRSLARNSVTPSQKTSHVSSAVIRPGIRSTPKRAGTERSDVRASGLTGRPTPFARSSLWPLRYPTCSGTCTVARRSDIAVLDSLVARCREVSVRYYPETRRRCPRTSGGSNASSFGTPSGCGRSIVRVGQRSPLLWKRQLGRAHRELRE